MNKFDIKQKSVLKALCFVLAASMLLFSACDAKKTDSAESIAVFVPGIVSGSPVYEMLVSGAENAVSDYNKKNKLDEKNSVKCTIIEAGTNQSEWSGKITALASSGEYSMILSSNPSLPDLVAPLTSQFPDVKFVLMDAFLEGNSSVAAVRYNQREQAFMAGYAAALVSASDMEYANDTHKIALVAAQEYPVMNNIIYPSYVEGAKAAVPDTQVDFVVVGNWYDASKGMELSDALFSAGTDVILPICGGASQGVIASAQKAGFYIAWFDDNGYSKAPGYVISSTAMAQDKMSYEMTTRYLEKTIKFGTSETVGIKEGYISFIEDDPVYISSVPESVRGEIAKEYALIKSGELLLPSP
ncbi:MAG: BMP family ABC transporter substrate-binding protein [Treponemataceae bacterium]|nr:BMP family ABC transporter substrate-binding protein [Treponemataceae bacterium]